MSLGYSFARALFRAVTAAIALRRRRDRPEQPVHLVAGTCGEEQRVLGPLFGAPWPNCSAQSPSILIGLWSLPRSWPAGCQVPLAFWVSRCHGQAPRSVELPALGHAVQEHAVPVEDVHEAEPLAGDVVFGAASYLA
jgi:hypothetical protein